MSRDEVIATYRRKMREKLIERGCPPDEADARVEELMQRDIGFRFNMAEVLDIHELDRVVLKEPVGSVPAGASGTVVAVYDGGCAFCIEFTQPIEALVDATWKQVEKADA